MSFANNFEQSIMQLIFQAVAIANIADDAGSSPLTNLQYSLHTGDPGEAGDQTTSETSYTGYARVAVARTAGGHNVTAGVASPAGNVSFPLATANPATITHFGVGRDSSAAGLLYLSGTVTPNLVLAVDDLPRLSTSTTITLE